MYKVSFGHHTILKSSKMIFNQSSSHIPCAIVVNSNLALDLDTTLIFPSQHPIPTHESTTLFS